MSLFNFNRPASTDSTLVSDIQKLAEDKLRAEQAAEQAVKQVAEAQAEAAASQAALSDTLLQLEAEQARASALEAEEVDLFDEADEVVMSAEEISAAAAELITLRYGTDEYNLSPEEFQGKTLGDLMNLYADELSMNANNVQNVRVRTANGTKPANFTEVAQPGTVVIFSVRAEQKGA